MRTSTAVMFSLACCVATPGTAHAASLSSRPIATTPSQLSYRNMPNLTRCLTVGIAAGNPMTGPSTVVLRFAPRCDSTMHWHTPNEQLVMVKGSGMLQMTGQAPRPVTVGAYNFQPSRHSHRFVCGPRSECLLYLSSDGRFDIHYVDPSGREISLAQAERMAGRLR